MRDQSTTLHLPRPYPECLKRHNYPFLIVGKEVLVGYATIRIVRAMDAYLPTTHNHLLGTMEENGLGPLPVYFGKDELLTLLSLIAEGQPLFRHHGYVITGTVRDELVGHPYVFHVNPDDGFLTVSEEAKSLPHIIRLGSDIVLLDQVLYNVAARHG